MTPEGFGRVTVAHLQGWLRAFQETDAAVDRQRDVVVGQGLRVVNGGQVSPWVEGKCFAEYTDDKTGEVLFSGEVTDPLDGWDETWFHVDRLGDEVRLPDHAVDPALPTPVREFLASMADVCLDLNTDGLRDLLGEITRSS